MTPTDTELTHVAAYLEELGYRTAANTVRSLRFLDPDEAMRERDRWAANATEFNVPDGECAE